MTSPLGRRCTSPSLTRTMRVLDLVAARMPVPAPVRSGAPATRASFAVQASSERAISAVWSPPTHLKAHTTWVCGQQRVAAQEQQPQLVVDLSARRGQCHRHVVDHLLCRIGCSVFVRGHLREDPRLGGPAAGVVGQPSVRHGLEPGTLVRRNSEIGHWSMALRCNRASSTRRDEGQTGRSRVGRALSVVACLATTPCRRCTCAGSPTSGSR